ncbi:MAG: hypothetical protein EA408_05965 [Marinilabiliales bacterium]|nr:MAG: hypothetical protein EA408_05965 [Marinilabiliales bacterium]
MRLTQFRIRHFRSIVDSGWNNLSPDNITALIGQNESGKTSVLEALHCFQKGTISEDVLRSDLSMPIVSCRFMPDDDNFDFEGTGSLPPGVLDLIKMKGSFILERTWTSDQSSTVQLSGNEITDVFMQIEDAEKELVIAALAGAEEVIKQFADKEKEIGELQTRITNQRKETEAAEAKLNLLNKQIKRSKDPSAGEVTRRNAEKVKEKLASLAQNISDKENRLSDLRLKIAEEELINNYSKECLTLHGNLEREIAGMEKAHSVMADIEQSIPFLKEEMEKKAGEARLFNAKEEYIKISRNVELLREKTAIRLRALAKIIDQAEPETAEEEAADDYKSFSSMLTCEEAGDLFFEYIPPFEFFEDFSSLLPNRIDLEDIFEDNARIEGYKAVRNFLLVAGLDPGFFRQTNNRILKQKIENLNNEVTVDFQEYWRQSLGKTNKIRIHFELEHYDISNPDKMGRPYLEFWIKDRHERLYPKQRSRGVRWFLSFYLELKAFARKNHTRNRILLIDEPGLSLHARAQEDVLKVFEDIKENIQIIYSTHSPHLIDTGKLYRLLAVQRSGEDREQSETIIFDASHLHSATSDTLSPVSSLLGAGITRREVPDRDRNIIVEDVTTFYYLSAFAAITGHEPKMSFIPAVGPAGVSVLVNLLTGWGLDFAVLLFDNPDNSITLEELQSYLHNFDKDANESRLVYATSFQTAEDLLSNLDFKKHIIRKRVGISGTNSAYIADNNISRPVIAASFMQEASAGTITLKDIDEETRDNLKAIFSSLELKLRSAGGT